MKTYVSYLLRQFRIMNNLMARKSQRTQQKMPNRILRVMTIHGIINETIQENHH